jgi:putative Mn2+ efflux pump MntP
MLQLLFFSADSFLAMTALGTLGLNVSHSRALCLAFGLCDGLATFAGLPVRFGVAAAHGSEPWFFAATMCLWVAVVALVAYRIQARGSVSLWQLTLLPVLLSLDNFFGGPMAPQIAAHAVTAPLFIGLLSGTLAFAGYQVGVQFSCRMHRRLAAGLGAAALLLLPILG